MPQSTKDSNGGKTHAKKETKSGGAASDAAVKKSAEKASASPVGPARHGEKKTTS